MVKVSDCGCCDCDDKQLRETIKERALSSINKIYTIDARSYYPDGTGMVTLPIPSSEMLDQIGINQEHIAANTADITDLEGRVDDLEETTGRIPTGYKLYRDGTGKIRLQAEATDGSLINSNVLDMIIPYQYDLISGTTSRSFRLQVTMSDGSQYLTNDFVIPEGGGTDVTVTGIVLSKDTGDVNRFHVGINLSDSTMIDSGYISLVDNIGAEYADGKLTISVNGVSSVPVAVDVTGEFSAGEGIKIASGTISISDELAARLTQIESDITNAVTIANRAFDAVTLTDNILTLERGNGGTESVTLPSGGRDEWEELDLDNLPTDFVANDEIKVQFKNLAPSLPSYPTSWTSAPSGTFSLTPVDNNPILRIFIVGDNTTTNFSEINQSLIIKHSNYYVTIANIAGKGDMTLFNSSDTSQPLFMLSGCLFNAGGLRFLYPDIRVTKANIKTYIDAMYRKRASS